MKDEIRLVIAFALAVIVILVFGKLSNKQTPGMSSTPVFPVKQKTVEKEEKPAEIKQEASAETPISFSVGQSQDRIVIENNCFVTEIDLLGGKIVEAGLKHYTRPGEEYFYILENSVSLLDYPKENIEWQNTLYSVIEKGEKSVLEGHPLDGLKERKELEIKEGSYTYDYKIKLFNEKNKEVFLKDYRILGGKISLEELDSGRGVVSQILIDTQQGVEKKNIAKIAGSIVFDNSSWICFQSGYKLVFLKSDQKGQSFVEKMGDDIIFGIQYPKITLSGKENVSLNFQLYAGPSDFFVVSKEINEPEIFGKGPFVQMGRLLFSALQVIHKVIPNWGWAIILLTLAIKLVFYPLSKKSLVSMKKLQDLRPYLKDIQKKYKDNPQQMQKEMMNLYKHYKINPFGGCIPMLIQFPIFIGFFIALKNSIFLRGAPFLLWMKDLSMPDALFPLPESIPFVDGSFNLLPILMAATSYWQQKLTPQEPSQKGLMAMMPFMFLFLFYNFSSGLLLYWVTMNLASLVEQYFIHKK